ncbi:MAG: MBL fold metallo-hydrolase [Pseudomonadota bacterium]
MSIPLTRRHVLAGAAALTALPFASRPATAQPFGTVVAETSFARLEELGNGVWAAVSTPLAPDGSFNPQTVCNGGIIAGKERVVAIDAFLQPIGSAWLASEAERLTGRPITDVILTHFHADHSGGVAGYLRAPRQPDVIATDTTRQLIYERYAGPQAVEGSPFARPQIRPVLPNRIITDETQPVQMDLGDRTLTLDPKVGHTPSDLAIHVDDQPVVFAGDLVWAGYFHNYVDAIPSKLKTSVADLLKDPQKTVVTGHGYIAKAGDLSDYASLLDLVEEKARASFDAGLTAAEGATDFTVPASLGAWPVFSPRYYETAFTAWYRELSPETAAAD